jgi:hypothetical protein
LFNDTASTKTELFASKKLCTWTKLYILIAQEFVHLELNFMDIQLKAEHKIGYLEQIIYAREKKVCTSETKHYRYITKC